ncbi:MAG: isoprenylcysteine carboxylmethyltransferase family protein [Candidatus Woesearchaeota archaeon]
MNIIGKPPINIFLFITGKISTYLVILAFIIQFNMVNFRIMYVPLFLLYIAFILFIVGIIIVMVASFDLGNSLRLGIPKEKTRLITNGLYAYSRNPIYFGLFILTLSSIMFTVNPIILVLGIYGLFVHHKIILAEEKFLFQRFAGEYVRYRRKVKRYF